jgi:hypothetical protein
MSQQKDTDKQFHVYVSDGTFHSGWDTEGAANQRAEQANAEAKRLGLSVTYVVKRNG